MAQKTKKMKFRKVRKYYYPNEDEFTGGSVSFYFTFFIVYLIYILVSPISFFFSDFTGRKEVYWEKIK